MLAQALLSYKALEVLGVIICVITMSAIVLAMMPANNETNDE